MSCDTGYSSENNTDANNNVDHENIGELKTYGPVAYYAISINCIFGTAVFGLPHAFRFSGYVLSALLLILGGLFNMLCTNFCFEMLSRCEGITNIKEIMAKLTENTEVDTDTMQLNFENEYHMGNNGTFDDCIIDSDDCSSISTSNSNSSKYCNIISNNEEIIDEYKPLLEKKQHKITSLSHRNSVISSSSINNFSKNTDSWVNDTFDSESNSNNRLKPVHKITFRKFDYSYIGYLFHGEKGRAVILIAMFLYSIVTLWSYCTAFSSSFAVMTLHFIKNESCDIFSDHPTSACNNAYYICLAVFTGIVLILSFMQIAEQAWIQNFLAFYRISALSIMVINLIIKMSYDGSSIIVKRFSEAEPFNFQHFGTAFGICLFSLICQYNLPDLLQPLKNKTKHARPVTMYAIITSLIGYVVIGFIGCFAFENPTDLVTLDWAGYTACGNGWEDCPGSNDNFLAVLIQVIVLVFPALCSLSTFPIVARTLVVSMEPIIPSFLIRKLGPKICFGLLRIIVIFFPVLFSACFKKIAFIFSLCGLFGFFLSLIVTCWFNYISIRYCKKNWKVRDCWKTPYDLKILSTGACSFICLICCCISLVYSMVNVLMTYL